MMNHPGADDREKKIKEGNNDTRCGENQTFFKINSSAPTISITIKQIIWSISKLTIASTKN